MPKVLGNKILEKSEGVLTSIHFLEYYLDTTSILAFSETCRTALRMSYKIILKELLGAAVCGNEDLVRKIVKSRPKLLLDSSAIVTDLSGKKITNLNPLQALICAGDVDMVQMIINVLQHKPQVRITLSLNPELEIQRQIASIYPNGDINAKEAEQIATAQEFKTSTLETIFTAINTATLVQVKFELDNPGLHTDSDLNAALHNFRKQFTTTSNLERIFNPFYLLNAFEFYDEKFKNINDNGLDQSDRRKLFWRQIIGYIQRHLPACYLQAFAQGLYYIVDNGNKLKRDFEFNHDNKYYMRVFGDLINLGYEFGGGGAPYPVWEAPETQCLTGGSPFERLLKTKKSGLEDLFTRRVADNYPYQPNQCVIS